MRKSIFRKYLTICSVIVIGIILVLSAIFSLFTANFFKEAQQSELLACAQTGTVTLSALYEEHQEVSAELLDSRFGPMGEGAAALFFIADPDGNVLYCTEGSNCVHFNALEVKSLVNTAAAEGEYSDMGKLGGLYADNHHTIGIPAFSEDGSVLAYVFVSAEVDLVYSDFISQMIRLFLLASASALIVTFFVVYFAASAMVKPLRQMASAARKFGKGDFNARIEIPGSDEMGQLALAMNNMAQSLSLSESSRRSFVANISHELKTPMTSIAGFIDGILDGTIPPEQEKHYLSIVSEETKRLARLVKIMLNLSKIEAGETAITMVRMNMVDTICQTVFSFERQIEDKHITIEGLDHEKVMAEADPDLIHQVIYNLTENAVKFVEEGGYIEFTFADDGQNTYVGIRNSGSGLAKEELAKVFERFYKTDKSRSLDKQGVGLGLYIVQSIISLHGGEIIVKSREGAYVEFLFYIPHKKPKTKHLRGRF